MCHSHSSVLFYWQLSITSHYTHVCLSHSSVLFIDNFLSHHTIPTCVRHIPVCCLLTTFYHITLCPRVSVTFQCVVYWQLSITSHYNHVCQTHSSVLFIDNFLSHHTIPMCVRHIPVCCFIDSCVCNFTVQKGNLRYYYAVYAKKWIRSLIWENVLHKHL